MFWPLRSLHITKECWLRFARSQVPTKEWSLGGMVTSVVELLESFRKFPVGMGMVINQIPGILMYIPHRIHETGIFIYLHLAHLDDLYVRCV